MWQERVKQLIPEQEQEKQNDTDVKTYTTP
jgi:hypothetical protein